MGPAFQPVFPPVSLGFTRALAPEFHLASFTPGVDPLALSALGQTAGTNGLPEDTGSNGLGPWAQDQADDQAAEDAADSNGLGGESFGLPDGGGALMGYTQNCCPDNKTSNAYHVVTAGPGPGAPGAILDGVTVKNGYADGTTPNHVGGGLLCQDSSPAIRHCIIECNAGSGGGGVAAWNGGAPTITHCTIRYNWGIASAQMANGIGGLNIYLSDAFVSDCTFIGNVGYGNRPGALMVGVCSPTLIRCTFEDNEAPSQGAAAGLWGTPTDVQLIGCTFSQNRVLNSGGIGGAVAISSGCATTLRDCTFTANEAVSNGGGVAVTGSTSHANLVQCCFTGNEAPSGGGLSVQYGQVTAVNCRFLGNQGVYGGGVFVQGGSRTGSANLTNCVFSGNVADGKTESLGGGLCVVDDGTATVTNCTLYGNASVAGDVALGGGVYVESATANVTSTIVWGNSTTWGSGETAQIYTWSPVSFSLSYSCVQNWTAGGLGGSYNTDDDPEFVDPDGVDNTIGTEDDDVRLGSGSSAIDAGCNAEVPEDDFDLDRDGDTDEALPWDLGRGTRFLDDSGTTDCRYGGSCGTAPIVDMGSYEYLNTNGLLGAPEPPEAGSPAPEPSGTAYIAFTYDALGRRIERIVDSGGASVEVTRYYYEGQNVILETDADEAPRRTYVHGSQYIDERVVMQLPNGEEYYYLPRELYSVAALTDETGAIVEAATYDTYGKVAVYDGSAQAVEESPVGNPYYFTGRRLDLLPLAGGVKQVYHYRARAYDPGNGRFMQRDPMAFVDGPNLMEYVGSAPLTGGDPSGYTKRTDVSAGKAVYTCNCGWIDFGHANSSPRIQSLINSVKGGQGTRSEFRDGFKVRYQQCSGGWGARVCGGGNYFVPDGLSAEEALGVALGIYLDASWKHETEQASWPVNWFTDSGFSEEDLVSDLIGFYMTAKGLTQKQIRDLCGALSVQQSLKIWDDSNGLGKNRNKDRRPVYHTTPCCPNEPKWPEELNSINSSGRWDKWIMDYWPEDADEHLSPPTDMVP